jgi:hypothetical protein
MTCHPEAIRSIGEGSRPDPKIVTLSLSKCDHPFARHSEPFGFTQDKLRRGISSLV